MDRQVRVKLAMATSVRAFSRAHPSSDGSYASVVNRLDAVIVLIEELAERQAGGQAATQSAAARRGDIRRQLQMGLLRHLVTTAAHADTESPGITEKFPTPNINATHAVYRARAGDLLNQARLNQELLVQHGLSETLLSDLETTLAEFDASLRESDDAKQTHVAARAEMKALSDEITRLVGILDGFNRYRFHSHPQLIVAWESAKHVAAAPQPKRAEDAAPPLTLVIPDRESAA
jgi:hypothetical protein